MKTYDLSELKEGSGSSTYYLIPREWATINFYKGASVVEIGKGGYVSTKVFAYVLELLGKSIKEWYDRWILNLCYDYKPRCPICNKPLEFVNVSDGYREFCSASCKMRYMYLYSDDYPDWKKYKVPGGMVNYMRNHPDEFPEFIKAQDELYSKGGAFGHMYENIDNYPEFKVNQGGRYSKHGWLTTNKAGEVYYESSWEEDYFKYLDSNPQVLEFQPHPFIIKYKYDNGEIHRYTPDVLVTYHDGHKELIEIKPESQVDWDINLWKFDAARKYCSKNSMIFKVITENEIYSSSRNEESI